MERSAVRASVAPPGVVPAARLDGATVVGGNRHTRALATELRRLQEELVRHRRRGVLVALTIGNAQDLADGLGAEVLSTVTSLVAQRLLTLSREVHLLAVSPLGGVLAAVLCEPHERDGIGEVVREACSGFVCAGSTRVWPVVTTGLRDLDGTPVEALLADVRQTAFEADRRFPGGVRWHDPRATDQPASRALTLTTDLADALDAPQDQLWLAFQPVRDLRTGRITAVEALLRWEHPVLGPVPPTEAVAVAEASGLILPLGAWVLHQALAQAASWWTAHRFVTAHVNVSPVELRDPSYADTVSRALRRHDLPPSALLLELTETDLMIGDREVRETLHRLRTLGVRLGIDDFGSGWSSIGQLLDLPVDTVKVDRSLTSRIDRSPADLDLLRAVLGLLDTAPVEVVVEGIENPAQASLLRNLGVRSGQGYHLGRPVPAAELSLGGGAAVRRTSA
jgi:EAL domain-containing protein (putative c-di-GMP-specific phosphodiesterase class I)